MKCCHHHTSAIEADPGFDGDDFTQAAARERRALAAHAHGAALLLSIIGGILFFGVMKSIPRNVK